MAPIQRGPESLLPRECGPAAPGEEAEPVVQPPGDFLNRKRMQARRGQLDRQGNAVQAVAHLSRASQVYRGPRKIRLSLRSALHEQAHGIILQQEWGGGFR